jgi:IclR family transcriptional regulator, KDG regulon repressor
MAYLDEEQSKRLVQDGHVKRFTPKTVLDLETLRKEWTRIRLRGWIYSSGEALDGVKAVAAPVRDYSGNVCAGLGVTFPAILLPQSRVPSVVKSVVKAASALSGQLGYKERRINGSKVNKRYGE